MRVETDGVYLVSGGGGSAAGAVAEVFREAGARLILVGRHGGALQERARSLGALAVEADLGVFAEAQRAVAEGVAAFGRLDGLIHTAGGFAMANALETDDAVYNAMLDDNLRTLHNAVRAALPLLLDRGNGFVAGYSSSVVHDGVGVAGMCLYAAAKAAVTFYLRCLEAEVRSGGVRVAIVYPMAPIDTPANRRAMPDADPAGWVDPAAIAEALLFAATRGRRGRLLELPVWPIR
jgi:NADP-dependent 3-hydroxy acid dehydrogenase YdfG